MTPIEVKDSDSSDSRNTYYSDVLTCPVDSFGFFFFSFSPSVVDVEFIGTMKSN